MECKTAIQILQVCLLALSISAEEITTAASIEGVEEVSSPAAVLQGRSLSSEENSIKVTGKRNPKFGFAIPFPNMPNMPGTGGDPNATPGPNQDTNIFGGLSGDATGSTALGTTAVLIKGGILTGLTALKAAIIPPIFLGALILFLIAGAAFFTCSVVNCGRIVGDFGGPSFGPGFGGFNNFSPFNRNGIEEYEQRPVYQAIDDGYKKFN